MKKMFATGGALFAANQLYAAVPTAVTEAFGDIEADVTTIIGLVLGVALVVVGFKYMRRMIG